MGRIFLVDLDQYIPNCYLCKACYTQIVSVDDFIELNKDYEFIGGVFEKDVNLQVDPPEKYRKTWSHLVANVHCITCCDYLGFKYVEIHPIDNVVRPNMLKLIMSKLMKQVGDAHYDGSVPSLAEDTSHLLNNF